ncbi:MAG: UDP-2,4-diacetamido-2,4,6-trideoxy-beta-L-altropyranose hydrolase [Mucilaginibacter sp.]
MDKRIVFRADGNPNIGYGHFIRTLGLVSLVNDEFDCAFAIQNPTEYQLSEISKVCNQVLQLSDTENNFDEFLGLLQYGDTVVIDSYSFDSSYQLKIRAKGCKVIYIDDHNDKHYVCDALINNIPGFSADSFYKENYTKLFLGTDYALLRKEFFNPQLRSIPKKKGAIFLSFGGSDILNLSEKIIGFLYEISPDFDITLLIGDAYKHHENLKRFGSLKTYKNINAGEVAALMASSEISIIPASSVLNEAASIGGKILLGYFSDNQQQPYKYFVENKLAIGLGDYRTVDLELFKSCFMKAMNAEFLIENQRQAYHYQQESNLKKIFSCL